MFSQHKKNNKLNSKKTWLNTRDEVAILAIAKLLFALLIVAVFAYFLLTKFISLLSSDHKLPIQKEINRYSYQVISNQDTFVKEIVSYEIIKKK